MAGGLSADECKHRMMQWCVKGSQFDNRPGGKQSHTEANPRKFTVLDPVDDLQAAARLMRLGSIEWQRRRMAPIPVPTVDNAPSVGISSYDTSLCGICHDPLDMSVHDGELRVHKMQCGHRLHWYCLDQWAKSKTIPIHMACPYKCHANAEEPIQLED